MRNKTKRRTNRRRGGQPCQQTEQSANWSIGFFAALISLILLAGALSYHQSFTDQEHEQIIQERNTDAEVQSNLNQDKK